jgi:hypothetical protein
MVEDNDFELELDDDVDDDDYDEIDELDTEVDDEEDDDLAWVKEAGADKVKKTWTQYTQTREEALAEKRAAEALRIELEPYKKLREDVMADPGLVKMIEEYYQNGRPVDREVMDIKTQVQGLQAQISTERELSSVRAWARENDYPDVEEQELLQYAVDNGVANLKSAYKDMMFEQVQERKAQELERGIKRSRGAKSANSKKPATGDRVDKNLATMSDEDFMKNYDEILKNYSQ